MTVELIKRQSCHDIETSQLICRANPSWGTVKHKNFIEQTYLRIVHYDFSGIPDPIPSAFSPVGNKNKLIPSGKNLSLKCSALIGPPGN